MNRVDRAINVFLDAVNNGTLAKGTCVACAVGNLVAHGLDKEIIKIEDGTMFKCGDFHDNAEWRHLFMTYADGEQTYNPFKLYDEKVITNIEATEFTYEELMAIEYAFETNTEISIHCYIYISKEKIRQDQINGLAAVVKVMLEFEETPEQESNVIIEKFKNDLILC